MADIGATTLRMSKQFTADARGHKQQIVDLVQSEFGGTLSHNDDATDELAFLLDPRISDEGDSSPVFLGSVVRVLFAKQEIRCVATTKESDLARVSEWLIEKESVNRRILDEIFSSLGDSADKATYLVETRAVRCLGYLQSFDSGFRELLAGTEYAEYMELRPMNSELIVALLANPKPGSEESQIPPALGLLDIEVDTGERLPACKVTTVGEIGHRLHVNLLTQLLSSPRNIPIEIVPS